MSIPKHPDGLKAPKSAAQLEQMLREHIPADRRRRLAVLVIDVSGPPAVPQKRGASSTKTKKKRAVTKKVATRKSLSVVTRKTARKGPRAVPQKRAAPSTKTKKKRAVTKKVAMRKSVTVVTRKTAKK